jgi:hypothetical protein
VEFETTVVVVTPEVVLAWGDDDAKDEDVE